MRLGAFSIILLLVTLCAIACTNKTTKTGAPNGGSDGPSAKSEEEQLVALLAKNRVADSGQAKVVADFITALRSEDAPSLESLLSAFAANEVSAQYGSPAAFAKAFREQEAARGKALPYAAFTDSYKKESDLGTLLTYTMGAARVAFYLENTDGQWRIDNILTEEALRIGPSAPALGMSQNQPAMAFYAYHNGAIFGTHPMTLAGFRAIGEGKEPPIMPWTGKPATNAERLAYLRQSSTQEFLTALQRLPGGQNLLGFLDAGKRELTRGYLPAELIPHSGSASEIHARLSPKEGVKNVPKSPVLRRMETVRRHGQWQLLRELE